MIKLTYKEIDIKDKAQLKKLVDIIMNNLDNEQFFIPFEKQEYDDMFNKSIMTSIGAYDCSNRNMKTFQNLKGVKL